MRNKNLTIFGAVLITILLSLSINATGIYVKQFDKNNSQGKTQSLTNKISSQPYNGYLRVYVVEPTSRWDNNDRDPYHYGFLDFAINEQLSIDYLGTYTKQVTWDAQQVGYSNVKENNIMVIAAVFNPEINKGYANPPSKNPFDAHYVDAAAGAKPGENGSNTVNEDFTHTVLVEEATAQYCPYCPAMAEALNSIYESDDYPFYFLALITKNHQGNTINSVALDYLVNNYNLYAYPSAFFDGGKKVLVGGYDDESYYRTRIEQCGKADVHGMDLNVSVVWNGNGVIDITVNITNNEKMPNDVPDTPTITGTPNGKPNKEYDFTVTTTDPEGGQVWYWIDWGDGTNTSWIGPFASGTGTTLSHTWATKENFIIKAKAKDDEDAESAWATFEIEISKNKATNKRILFVEILLSHLKMFPLFKQILQKITLLK